MVVVRIGTRGVEGVSFEASRNLLEDPTVQLWPLLEKELVRLDRAVKRSNSRLVSSVFGKGTPPTPDRVGSR